MAQLSGDNVFIPGRYVQVAIAPNGSFGSTVNLPSGYYHNAGGSIYAYDPGTRTGSTTGNRLAFIYDAGHDGWTAGSPNYFGDYTLPGTPYEGWSVQVNGSQGNAFYTNLTTSGATGYSGSLTMTGTNTSYSNTGGVLVGVWTGTAGSGGALAITQITTVDTNASWIKVTTKFKNTTSSALPNVYYMRAFDPDNDQTASGGSYNTTNTINYQNDYYHRVMVTAAGTHYTTQTVALATKDCRAKCFSSQTWPTAISGNFCSAYYAGTGSYTSSGAYHVAYSGSQRGDYAIGLVYNLGTIAAGDSTSLSYAFVFNGSLGIDSAYTEPQLIANGAVMDTIDTATACTFSGDTLLLNITNGNTFNWSGAHWTWAPNTSLLTDTGVSTGVIMSGITSAITYTITGSDSALGNCLSKTFLLTVYPTSTTAPVGTDVSYCVGATASPLTATGTSLLWYTTATGGTGSTTAPTPTTSTSGSTDYYVSQTIAGCESPRDTVTVTVSPGAAAITGPTNVCNGFTTSLSDASPSGTWSSSASSIASVGATTGNVAGVSPGTATITYTLPTGCYVTANMVVNAQPGAISGPTAVCVGSAINLTDTSTTGTWSSGNTSIASVSSAGVVTGVAAGTTGISYTLPTGCVAYVTITVNALPSAIAGPSSVCVGSAITLSSTGSGTWTSASVSNATVSSSGVVTGVASGSAVITYTLATGCYRTATVTVNALPSAISGPTAVCQGSSITLSSSPTGGNWASANTSVAQVVTSSGVVTGIVSGTSNITYTAPNGCQAATTVAVNPLPTAISGSSAVCVGASVTLSSTPTTGTWTSSAPSTATVSGSGGLVTGAAAGSATITYTLPTTCYVTKNITVNATPTAITGTPYLCENGGITNLGSTPSGGNWSSSNTGLATVNASGMVTGVNAGSVTITYTTPSTGCYTTAAVTVNALPTAISGPSAFCVAGSATFTDGTTGGNWTSSDVSIVTINPSSGVATGVSAGSANITYSLGTGCTVNTNVTINPLPANITGTPSVCEAGSITTLYDATPSGYWSSRNTAIATVDASGVVTGVSAGSVFIDYILSATGCGIGVNVTVNPLPANITGPGAVCAGLTINLSNASAGGSWTSGNTSVATINSAGMLYGVANGTSIVTYTLPTGCIITRSIAVNPLPTSLTGTSSVCATLTTTLASTTTGGTWSSSNAAVASVNSAGVVAGVAAGTADITYTIGTGCITTRTVTVNPLPAAITGASNVCNTYSTLFADITTGGSWSSGNTAIATVSAGGNVTGNSPGTTIITYTLGTGCLQTAAITVDALPAAISGATHVCVNATVALSNSSGSGAWTTSNASVATIGATSGVVTGLTAGTSIITFTAGGGCFITMNMTVDPLPVAIVGSTNVCEGANTTFSNASGTGSWASSNTSIATIGTSSGIVTGVSAGTLNITFTLATSCYITSTMTVDPTPRAMTGVAEVCAAGATTLLADTLAGGSWTSADNSIATATTRTTTTGTITGVAAGTVNITYTVGRCYNTVPVLVHPLPGAVITPLGDTALCPGAFVVLSSSTGTGYTFQWYAGTTAISGATDDYYLATTGANYKVQVTSSHSCVSNSIPMAVSINPAIARAVAATATTICSGSSATLNANTGVGLTYQWLAGGAGISGATSSVYFATTGGNYSVIVSNAAGCSANSAAIPVTVQPSPTNSLVASGPLNFCNGGSVTLTADTGSGYSYQWQNGGTNIAGATNINYTTTTTGNYQVMVTNSYPCTSTSAIAAVTTLSLPSATITTAGSSSFCTGGSVTLSAPVVSGNSYQWSRNGTRIPGAVAPYYTTATGGNFTVLVTSAAGCIDSTSPAFPVSELTTPVIVPLSQTSFCWGGSASLGVTVSISGGVTYQWQLNGIDIAGATNSGYSAAHSGDYSCVVTIVGACTAASYAVHITEYPLPNPVISFDGLSLHTGNFYNNYQWFRNLASIGVGTASWMPTEPGDYSVKVIDSNGCQSVSNVFQVLRVGNGKELGVTNPDAGAIQIFPNPAQNTVHVAALVPLRAVILAADGRKVGESTQVTDIDISQLDNGIYMLMLFDAQGQMLKSEKLTKN